MRVLLTGSSGFLGRHVAARLSQSAGHKVFGFDNHEVLSGHGYSASNYDDVTSFEDLFESVLEDDVHAIVHLAALGRNLTCQNHPQRAWEVNVNGTLNVLEVARQLKLKRVVVCSSNITLSDQLTVYRESKRAVESLVALYASLGVSVMGLRPSNIYGRGQSRTEYQPCAMAGLDIAYENLGYIKITGDGEQTRDWIHVEDVARAFELALTSNVVGQTFDVCTGIQTSMNKIRELLDVRVHHTAPRPGDAKELISSPREMYEQLGFSPELLLDERIMDAFPAIAASRKVTR